MTTETEIAPAPSEIEITYTAVAAGVVAYGDEPDMAIANLLTETQHSRWDKWWMVGEIKVYIDLSANGKYAWCAEVKMSRTIEIEI